MWSGDSDDRPRERLLREGPRRLSNVELVACVLRNGRAGQTAVDLASALLAMHGDVGSLAVARPDMLADYAGMGPAKAAAVAAAFELGRRTTELAECVPIRRAEDVVAVARREARGVRRDELLVLVTDSANRVRWTVGAVTGIASSAAAAVRRVVDVVMAHAGVGFALARLSTEAAASVLPVDERIADRLTAAALYAELRFLDYVVVADTTWCGVRTGVPLEPPAPTIPLPGRRTTMPVYDIRAGP